MQLLRLRFYTALLPMVGLLLLTACQPPQPGTVRATAATILDITPAATIDIDATATNYARQLIPSPTPSGLYVVQAGDTLSALAQEFGTSVDEIMAANGLTDANAIQVGQTLIIPSLLDRPLVTAAAISPTVPTEIPTRVPTNTALPTKTRTPTKTAAPTDTAAPEPTIVLTDTPILPPPTNTSAPVPLDIPTETVAPTPAG